MNKEQIDGKLENRLLIKHMRLEEGQNILKRIKGDLYSLRLEQ